MYPLVGGRDYQLVNCQVTWKFRSSGDSVTLGRSGSSASHSAVDEGFVVVSQVTYAASGVRSPYAEGMVRVQL